MVRDPEGEEPPLDEHRDAPADEEHETVEATHLLPADEATAGQSDGPSEQSHPSTTEPSKPEQAGDYEERRSGLSVDAMFALLVAWAALAVGSVLALLGIRQPNVPLWTAPVALAAGVVTIVGAFGWLHYSHVAERSGTRTTGEMRALRSPANWRNTALYAAAGLAPLIVFALIQAFQPVVGHPEYDGVAPEGHPCQLGSTPASDRRWELQGPEGELVGVVELVASRSCSTLWARVRHEGSAPLDGKQAIITMVRPEDGTEAEYRSKLRTGKRVSGGNMLYNGAACVRAEVTVMELDRSGPTIRTDCLRA